MIKLLNSLPPVMMLVGVAALGPAAAAFAQATAGAAQDTAAKVTSHVFNYLDFSAAAGIATNPQLGSSNGTAGLGRVSAYAVHSVVGERNTLQLTAYAENQSYTNEYRSTQSFELAGDASRQASPRLKLYGGARFRSDIGGQLYNRFFDVPLSPVIVDVSNPLPAQAAIDPALIALNRNRYQASGQIGLSYKLSARDSLNGSLGYEHVFFSGTGNGLNYDVLTATTGWDHQISERTTAGARLVAQRSTYGAGGNSSVISPQVTVRTRLAEGWSASGSAGVSFVDQHTPTISGHSTNLNFDGALCRETLDQEICARAARANQASIGQSVVQSTSASLSYFRRLSPKDTIQAAASVARSSGQNRLLFADHSTYYTGSASYNRKFSPRFSGGVEGSLSKIDQANVSIPFQASATAYIRYRLGDIQ